MTASRNLDIYKNNVLFRKAPPEGSASALKNSFFTPPLTPVNTLKIMNNEIDDQDDDSDEEEDESCPCVYPLARPPLL